MLSRLSVLLCCVLAVQALRSPLTPGKDVPAQALIQAQAASVANAAGAEISVSVPDGQYIPNFPSPLTAERIASWLEGTAQDCSTCGANEYASSTCSATANTVCSQCTPCGDNEFEDSANSCGGTSNTKCNTCRSCTHEETSAGCSGTDDRTCTPKVGKIGELSVGSAGVDLDLSVFTNPVVITGPPTFADNRPFTIRGDTNVDGSDDMVATLAAEHPCSDQDTTADMAVSYLALNGGFYGDYAASRSWVNSYTYRARVGRRWRTRTRWTGVEFPWGDALGDYPLVFAWPQTVNNPRFGIIRQTTSANSGKFYAAIENSEDVTSTNANGEFVGYLAFRSNCVGLAGNSDNRGARCGVSNPGEYKKLNGGQMMIGGETYTYELGLTRTTDTHVKNGGTELAPQVVNFETTFASKPFTFANTLTRNGGNPSFIRTYDVTTTSFSFTIDEEQCANSERQHVEEFVSVLAIGKAA